MANKSSIFEPDDSLIEGRVNLKRELAAHENWVEAILPADAEAGKIETETSRKPLLAIALLGAAFIGILITRLFWLQIVGGAHNLGLANGNRIRQRVVRAPRGVIYDRNNAVLARNQASFDVVVVPQQLPKAAARRQTLYDQVSSIIGMSAGQIKTKAEASGLDQFQPQLVMSGLDRDKALVLDQNSATLSGFSLDVNPIRQYMDSGELGHVLGYTGRISPAELTDNPTYLPTDYIGKLGIEKQYESVLAGSNGSEQTEVDAAGQPIKVLANRPAVPGSNLVLTIDQALEDKLTQAITEQMQKANATQAAGVALNPKTGEVLASVSLPGYDANLFSRGISQSDYAKLASNPAQPLFNKAESGAYPTGSIIKPLVASAALQEGVVTPDTTIVDQGKLEVTNQYDSSIKYTYFGWEHSGLGVMNVYRAIAMSSDIYFYTVAGGFEKFIGLGINRLDSYYQKFGIGAKTGIDLPDETAGRLPTPDWKLKTFKEPWYTGDTYNIAVGQGDVLASPLQMAVATAAIANGGELLKPQLVKQILTDQGDVIKTVTPEVVRKDFISSQNLGIVRNAMRQTVASGTACCVFDKQVPVPVAGKTGTAETDPANNAKPDAWFTSFAPYNDPQIVIVVMIASSGEGAEYAVPAVRETLAWCFTRPGGCVK